MVGHLVICTESVSFSHGAYLLIRTYVLSVYEGRGIGVMGMEEEFHSLEM